MQKELDWLEDLCHEHRIRKTDVAVAIGTSRQNVQNMGKRDIGLSRYVSMCQAVGIDPGQEMNRLIKAGLL